MSSNKKYWKSVEELNENSSIVEALRNNEFVEEIPTDEFLGNKNALTDSSTTRRDFLKYVGFSTAAASLAACEGPVHRSIPYLIQPEQIIPGGAIYWLKPKKVVQSKLTTIRLQEPNLLPMQERMLRSCPCMTACD